MKKEEEVVRGPGQGRTPQGARDTAFGAGPGGPGGTYTQRRPDLKGVNNPARTVVDAAMLKTLAEGGEPEPPAGSVEGFYDRTAYGAPVWNEGGVPPGEETEPIARGRTRTARKEEE